MKKIILATTALVSVAFAGNALAQESQMMSAMGNDINIGGYYEFSYQDYSDDGDSASTGDGNDFSGDSELFIDFASVSDSGLEYGVGLELEIVNGHSDGTSGDNNIDEASIYIAGDFGRVVLGHNDHGGDSFQTWIGTDRTYGQDDAPGPKFVNVGEGGTQSVWNASVRPHTVNAPYGDGAKITYLSPIFSGFQFGVSMEDYGGNDDATSVGAKYDFTVYGVDVTLKAAGYSGIDYGGNNAGNYQDNSSTSYGATFGYGDFTFTAASAEFEINEFDSQGTNFNDDGINFDDDDIADTTAVADDLVKAEPEVLGFGLGYNINEDLFVSAYYATSEDDATNQELSTTSVGATYTIANGLTATAALNSFELEETNGTGSNAVITKNEGEQLVLQVEFAF